MGSIGNIAVILLTLCIASAQAADTPSHIQSELPDARLLGQGTFRWFGLKVYEASLWVGEKGYQAATPGSNKLILNLNYARDLYGERIAQASIDEIRQLGLGSSTQQEEWLNKMKALFPNVQEGSQISGVFIPNEATRFYLNGKLLGEISDAEFSRAFFAIWLDPRTSAAALRNQLLGQQP